MLLPSLSPHIVQGEQTGTRGGRLVWWLSACWRECRLSEEMGLGEKALVSPPVSADPPGPAALGLGSIAKTPLRAG